MFKFKSVFESLIFRKKNENEVKNYKQVKRVLREEIVKGGKSDEVEKNDRKY
jgi:hypothetical protein